MLNVSRSPVGLSLAAAVLTCRSSDELASVWEKDSSLDTISLVAEYTVLLLNLGEVEG